MNHDNVYLVDCDEVLGDCVNPMLDELHAMMGKRFDKSSMDSWDILQSFGQAHLWPELKKRVAREGFCSNFPLLPGAVEGMRRLEELPGTVVVVTSPMDTPHWAFERTMWLKKHFGLNRERIIHTSGKEYVQGTCLVDDKVDNLLRWKARNPNGIAYLWPQPYNKNYDSHLITKVSSWNELIDDLKSR